MVILKIKITATLKKDVFNFVVYCYFSASSAKTEKQLLVVNFIVLDRTIISLLLMTMVMIFKKNIPMTIIKKTYIVD